MNKLNDIKQCAFDSYFHEIRDENVAVEAEGVFEDLTLNLNSPIQKCGESTMIEVFLSFLVNNYKKCNFELFLRIKTEKVR